MNSTQMKMVVLCWFRFKKRWNHIATEVGAFNADVVGTDGKFLFEVEVKMNMRDFRADFQKQKHRYYADKGKYLSVWKKGWIPNKFFFAVPPDLVLEAKDVLEDHPQYGLLTVNWKQWWRTPEIKTVRQAKFLHKNPPPKKTMDLLIHRMSSEICGHYIKNEAEQNKRSHMIQLVKKLVNFERKR